jgi:ferredoxin-NADP reductase
MSALTSTEPRVTGSASYDQRLRVESVQTAADGVALMRLVSPDGGPLPPWQPGDHLELVLPSGLVRHYSLCGALDDPSSYTVAVLRVADGRGGSREIHDAGLEGRELVVRGPRNNFPLVDADSYILLAGGIGITPLVPMALSLHDRGAPYRLIYGARSHTAMAFRAELAALGEDRVEFVPEDTAGRPDLAAVLNAAPEGTAVYCCGPEPMIGRVEELCAGRPWVTLHVERFGSDGPVVLSEGERPFELELARTGVTLQVPADRTALDVVHDVLPDHPYSCLGGQCGSCEVAVLSGDVDHRDEVLSEDEQLDSTAMMLCVSRARSARVTIEL